MDPIALLTIFVLAVFVGFEVVSKVSSTLHTPLMSGANAIHGIILVGAIIVAGSDYPVPIRILGAIALAASTANIVSGFLITDRMLKMFKQTRGDGASAARAEGGAAAAASRPEARP